MCRVTHLGLIKVHIHTQRLHIFVDALHVRRTNMEKISKWSYTFLSYIKKINAEKLGQKVQLESKYVK